jgi:hypothetical protein
MENKIVSFYKVIAYVAILWAACQPQPFESGSFWRESDSAPISGTSSISTARPGE